MSAIYVSNFDATTFLFKENRITNNIGKIKIKVLFCYDL